MDRRKVRLLLWAGCLGAAVLFAGDMLFYGNWGSGRSFTPDNVGNVMANVALWRLQLGSITGPIGVAFDLLGMLGLWFCCRRASPRLAAVMFVCMYTMDLSGVLQHGIFGPLGFAFRYCGRSSEAVTQILKLNSILSIAQIIVGWIGLAIWFFLTLKKRAGVPRWTVFFHPILTMLLVFAVGYVPAPLGYPLAGGWSNIRSSAWFAVLALTYKDAEIESRAAETRESEPSGPLNLIRRGI